MNAYNYYDDQDTQLDGLFDDAKEYASEVIEEVKTGVTEAVTEEIDEAKQDMHDEIEDTLNVEQRAKDAMKKKLDEEIKRASQNASRSLVGMLTKEEVDHAVKEGRIVLDPSGNEVRDTATGAILTRAQYEAQIAAKLIANRQAAIIIKTILIRLRDEVSYRNTYFTKLNRQIAQATGAAKQQLITAKQNVLAWLLVNPSKNPAARTPEQIARIEKYVNDIQAEIIRMVERFKRDPTAYANWEREMYAKINQGVPNAAQTLEKMRLAVKSPLSAVAYADQETRQKAEDIIAKGTDLGVEEVGDVRTGFGMGGAGTAIALAVGGWLLTKIF